MDTMDTENTRPASFKTKYIDLLHGSIALSLAQYPQTLAYQKQIQNFAEQQKVRDEGQQGIMERF